MTSMIHALNIGTLATWLSVLGFGAVGVLLPGWHAPRTTVTLEKLETLTVTADLTLDEDSLGDSSPPPAAASPPTTPETLPAPPALPDIASVSPLPEVPELADAPKVTEPTRSTPQPTPRRTPRATTSERSATSEKPATSERPGAVMSGKDRIAAGRMPAPDYPTVARRNHQEGTVVVRFSVNSSGRVTAAFAKNPSRWPLLNEAAIRTVRRWSFPPGAEITIDRPIVFRLK